ncbi:hypothetical protein D3C87_2144340 [compost metagenome]
MREDSPAAFSASGIRTMARRMTSAAVPCIGALIAARSANCRWATDLPPISGMLIFRPKMVVT